MKYSPNMAVATALGLTLFTPTLPAHADDLKANVFAPGVISTEAYEGPFAFTPDGRSIYFARFSAGMRNPGFFVSHLQEGKWMEPKPVHFPASASPAPFRLSPDGGKLCGAPLL
jgi:hypothetical protein